MKCILIIFATILAHFANAQTMNRTTVAAAGDHFVTGEFSLSVTVGDPGTFMYFEDECVLISTGFQQADEFVACEGDFNHDHQINIVDMLLLSSDFGETGICVDGDLDHNLIVNIVDYLLFSTKFGDSCE